MKIAISGLGRMGGQIAHKLAENGHEVIAHNRSHGPIKTAVDHGAAAAYSKEEVTKAFQGEQPVIWVMLPENVVESELAQWLDILPAGSLLIDGGNSDFRQTKKTRRTG